MVLGIELKPHSLLGKHSTTELHSHLGEALLLK